MNLQEARGAVSNCKADEFIAVWRTEDGGEQYEHVPRSKCTCGFGGHFVSADSKCFPGLGPCSSDEEWREANTTSSKERREDF